MTQPSQQPAPQATNTQVARVAAIFAAAVSVDVAAHALAGVLGVPLTVAVGLVKLNASAPTPRLPDGPSARVINEAELTYRAAYLANAGLRIKQRLDAGASPDEAAGPESALFRAHRAAQRGRARASAAVDSLARRVGLRLRWRAVMDERTSGECRLANGKTFRADSPPQIGLPGSVHANCFPAGTLVTSPGVRATTERWYSGEIVEITTRRGHTLTVTPNHPVLTPQGWVAAGLLDEGRDVVSTRFGEALTRYVDPDDYQVPSLIEDVAAAFSERRSVLAVAVPEAAEDFHGDGISGQVAVVRTDRILRDGLNLAEPEPRGVQQFVRLRRDLAVQSLGVPFVFGGRPTTATDGFMRRLHVARVLLRRARRHHELVGVGVTPPRDARVLEHVGDPLPGHAVGFGELVLAGAPLVGVADVAGWEARVEKSRYLATVSREVVRRSHVSGGATFFESFQQDALRDVESVGYRDEAQVAALVELDRVVKVRKWASWSGHVFNLETSAGWYVSGNILVHNCRCTAVPASAGTGSTTVDQAVRAAHVSHEAA